MDQLTLAEIYELGHLASVRMDAQFQYWLSVTFAVVVAAFVAGDRLNKPLRYLAALLYLLAAFVLISQFRNEGMTAYIFGQAMSEGGLDTLPVTGYPVIVARFVLFALGTLAALYFLLRPQDQRRSD